MCLELIKSSKNLVSECEMEKKNKIFWNSPVCLALSLHFKINK